MPMPGSKRTFHSAELASLAQRYSIRLDDAPDVCFEWPMEPLPRTASWRPCATPCPFPTPASRSSKPVPLPGPPRADSNFPRQALEQPAPSNERAPVLWRGDVVYGGDLRYASLGKGPHYGQLRPIDRRGEPKARQFRFRRVSSSVQPADECFPIPRDVLLRRIPLRPDSAAHHRGRSGGPRRRFCSLPTT